MLDRRVVVAGRAEARLERDVGLLERGLVGAIAGVDLVRLGVLREVVRLGAEHVEDAPSDLARLASAHVEQDEHARRLVGLARRDVHARVGEAASREQRADPSLS